MTDLATTTNFNLFVVAAFILSVLLCWIGFLILEAGRKKELKQNGKKHKNRRNK